jgi:hypothetical protein
MLKMSVISKSAMLATILALAVATFSATSVFAASLSTSKQENTQNLTSIWKSETAKLYMERFEYNRQVSQERKWLKSTGPTSADKLSADQFLDKFAFYLKQADVIASKHVGFDTFGKVINLAQATKTTRNLQIPLSNLNKISTGIRNLISPL